MPYDNDSKLPSNWVKKLSKTKNTSYFFNKATGESVWSHPETSSSTTVNSPNSSRSSLNKLNSSSRVITKSPAQDRLQRIQQELIAKQLIATAKTIPKPNDAKSTASSCGATKQSNWSSPKTDARNRHSNWLDENTTKSTPANSKFTKTNSSSIPTPKNTKTSGAISKCVATNLSRNIKLPCPTAVPLKNRLKFSKIPKFKDKSFEEENVPEVARNASDPKTGKYSQNDRKRKADNVLQSFKTRLVDGTGESNTKKKCTGKANTIDTNILQSQVSSIPPNLPEEADVSNRNIRMTDQVEANLVDQKSTLSDISPVQPKPSSLNAVLPISESTQETPSPKSTPFMLPDTTCISNDAKRVESSSIFAGIFSGLKSFTKFWEVPTTTSEQLTNNVTLPKHNSSTRNLLDSAASVNGIVNNSKKELTSIQHRLKVSKELVPSLGDHNEVCSPRCSPRDNSLLDDVDVEMTDDDDMTSDSNGKYFISSLTP